MTIDQRNSLQILMELGIDHRSARIVTLYGDLEIPFSDSVQENIALLRQNRRADHGEQIVTYALLRFLKRDPEINRWIISVPDQYGFSEEEKECYFKELLLHEIEADLKSELDEKLKLLVSDSEIRKKIYREMYCNGAWQDCETIRKACDDLYRISAGHTDIGSVVYENWVHIASRYADTSAYIAKLEEYFTPGHVWEVYCDDPFIARLFGSWGNSWMSKEDALISLKKRYVHFLSEH